MEYSIQLKNPSPGFFPNEPNGIVKKKKSVPSETPHIPQVIK